MLVLIGDDGGDGVVVDGVIVVVMVTQRDCITVHAQLYEYREHAV